MITWGFASAATMFAVGVWSLYGIRIVVGAAEAGFFPGILLYLTYWFPRTFRARASALFIMGIPATIAIASTLSGLILQMHGLLGLAGWQWLFLLEGLPAVLLGVACLFYLDDGPTHAKWLSQAEKEQIALRLQQDRDLEQTAATRRGILSSTLEPQRRPVIGSLLRACYVPERILDVGPADRPQHHSWRELRRYRLAYRPAGDPRRCSDAPLGRELRQAWRARLARLHCHVDGGDRLAFCNLNRLCDAALFGVDLSLDWLVLWPSHVLDVPGIDRDLIVRCTAGGDCTYQLRRDWGRIGNRPGRNRLSQGSDGHFHFRAHLRYGNVDGERDLHQYRFSANAHCNASAKLKHSLKVRVSVCEPNGSKAQETRPP